MQIPCSNFLDVFGAPLFVGDTIITIKNPDLAKYWWSNELILRKYKIAEIAFVVPTKLYYNYSDQFYYYTWRSEPFLNGRGEEITVSGHSRKYKTLKHIERYGAKSPWIYKVTT